MNDLMLLTDKQRHRLEESWTGVFRHEVFARIDERPFAVLYSIIASRRITPAGLPIRSETIKAGFNGSDEEMYDAICHDLQTRYAVGYEKLGERESTLRSVCNFRRCVHKCREATSQDLIAQSIAQITDAQFQPFHFKTSWLRVDSTQVSSNICDVSRLHLAVEILKRVYRMLSGTDQVGYNNSFAPYLKITGGQ
jgi:hypothetical protein